MQALRFSLSSLLVLVTGTCLLLALPTGSVLMSAILSWFFLGVAILSTMLMVQAPVYFLLSAKRQHGDGIAPDSSDPATDRLQKADTGDSSGGESTSKNARATR